MKKNINESYLIRNIVAFLLKKDEVTIINYLNGNKYFIKTNNSVLNEKENDKIEHKGVTSSYNSSLYEKLKKN